MKEPGRDRDLGGGGSRQGTKVDGMGVPGVGGCKSPGRARSLGSGGDRSTVAWDGTGALKETWSGRVHVLGRVQVWEGAINRGEDRKMGG